MSGIVQVCRDHDAACGEVAADLRCNHCPLRPCVAAAEVLKPLAWARKAFDALCNGFDVVLTPSAPGEAPEGLHTTGDFVFNGMWTVLHMPCLGIPCITGPQGLPVGIQIVGPRYSDARLLHIAAAIAPVIDVAAEQRDASAAG